MYWLRTTPTVGGRRGPCAFVGTGRGHPSVGHHDIGILLGGELQQLGWAAGRTDGLEVAVAAVPETIATTLRGPR